MNIVFWLKDSWSLLLGQACFLQVNHLWMKAADEISELIWYIIVSYDSKSCKLMIKSNNLVRVLVKINILEELSHKIFLVIPVVITSWLKQNFPFFSPPKPTCKDKCISALVIVEWEGKGQRYALLGFLIRVFCRFYLKFNFSVLLPWLIAVFMIYSGILLCFAFVKTTKCMPIQTWIVTHFAQCPLFITVTPLKSSHDIQVPSIGNNSAIFLWFPVGLISISIFPAIEIF